MPDDAVLPKVWSIVKQHRSVLEMQIWGPIPSLIQTLWGRDPAAWLLTAQQMVVLQTEV